MYDVIIKGGRVVDGSGGEPFVGDLAITEGRIDAVGDKISGRAKQTIDADGALVAPGWVDVHTHYDGQVAWDDTIDPSASNGVTTAIMGNCGVGFAPVPRGGEKTLIELMEGVEDIPGTALYEGIPWGQWETFPEYLDFLRGREYALDIGAQLAHGALRNYVMGERGRDNSDETIEDIQAMGRMVEESLRAGAVGVSTSRTIGHQSLSGGVVPGTFAAEAELMAFAGAINRVGYGVLEVIPANAVGPLQQLGGEKSSSLEELALMARLSTESKQPVTFTMLEVAEQPTLWRTILGQVSEYNQQGAQLRPQIPSRPIGMITGLTGYHMFMRREPFLKIADLPLEQLVAEMRKPEVKAAILAGKDVPHPDVGSMKNVYKHLGMALSRIFRMGDPVNYEPDPDNSVAAMAERAGSDADSFMYDLLLEDNGRSFCILLGSSYLNGNLDVVHEMLSDPHTITGLSDAGAHVSLIVDGSMPTYQLTHWCRDRSRGEKLPVEFIVNKQTARNAALYGLNDRGLLQPGLRADINVIDLDRLGVSLPEAHYDLPAGGRRIMQPVQGYIATFVNGVRTRANDQDTGARPGRVASQQP